MSHLQGHSASQTQTYAGGNTIAQGHSYTHGEHGHAQAHTQTYGHAATETYAPHSHPLHVLDDRDILTDLLLSSKQLLSAYGTAAIESTNPQLRQTLKQIAKTESDFHTRAFDMMHQRGWYETPRSDANLARQVAALWTQKIQQHEHQGAQQQQYNWQGQQQTDGYPLNNQWNSQPTAGQWGLQQTHGQWDPRAHTQEQWQPQPQHAAARQWEPSPSHTRSGI